ncbi:MAG: hypothetical protein BA861_06345 [Desulfobacterales bacterium S3730MH5]|nr:MAG: hypothetical protein BA861_06345 [Desulfobacterales bacterium S3730MH5]
MTQEAVKGEKTIAELSSEFGIHGEQIRQWKKRLLDGLLGIFSDKRKEGGKGRRATRNGYIAGSLDHSQDRRLLFLKGSASRCAFERSAPPRPILAANGFRTSLVVSLHVDFIALYYSTEFAAWLPCTDFPAKKGCHIMRYVWVQVQLHGNLAIGEI